jgi:WD40 repeat protein
LTLGNIIVSGTPSTIRELTPTGTLVQTLPNAGPGSTTTGMCFDATGALLVTLFSNGTVAKYDLNGNLATSSFITAPGSPEACVRDSAGNFYVTSVGGVAAIRKFSSTGTPLSSFQVGARSDWLDLAADQCTMYYGDETPGNKIHGFNVCTNTALADLSGSSGQYTALRVLPGSGDIIVANGATNTVQRFSSAGTLIGAWTPTGFTGTIFSLNLDPDGATFWTGSTTGNLFRFALSGFGTQLININTGNNPMYGVAVVGEITTGGGGPPPPTVSAVIPTLSEWALGLLALILASIAVLRLRRGRARL